MKKKIAIVSIACVVILSGLGASAIQQQDDTNTMNFRADHIQSSAPMITEHDGFIAVSIAEQTSTLMQEGRPMTPVISHTFTFPVGTRVEDISVSFDTASYALDAKVQPAPKAVPLTDKIIVDDVYTMDSTVYQQDTLFPQDSYTIRKGVGRDQADHVIFVTVDCFVQYNPVADLLVVPEDIDLEVKYELPKEPLLTADEFDMLIITTEEFVDELQPLVDHKNNNGIMTAIDTVENIYASYNGRDAPEDIKLRIKDAIEEWGISYVLIGGGRAGQTYDWHVPPRTVHNDDGWEAGYDSDLYYADVYKLVNDELVFEDWDSNDDGTIGEFNSFMGGDEMDYYPDVSVGRLPFRTADEATTIVNKIIDYETNAQDSWFKKGIVISGDTFPPSRGGDPGWPEGELETGITVDLLEDAGFTMEKLWLSIPGAWEGPEDVIAAISGGAGFVHFAGHSNPASWGNHPPDDEEDVFIDGIRIWDMKQFSNDGQYPIVMLGGCHSAQFNVTMLNMISGILEYGIGGYFFTQPFRFFYFEWVPHDLSSKFVLTEGGGAVASMGNTGLGYGYVNEGWNYGLGGWLEPRFFDIYVNQSIDILGDAHDQSITDYINIIGNVNSDQIDRKTIEEHVLLGDPSMKMGGL